MNVDLAPDGAVALSEAVTLALGIVRTPEGKIAPLRDEAIVLVGGEETTLSLRPLRALFSGNRKAPDLSRGPTPELMPFFLLLETTLVRFCAADERDETDQEMERIWSQLRRRPDGVDCTLHSYLRAAARVYMTRNAVSQAEYEAVLGRLAKSARAFAMAPISRNYVATLRETLSS